MEIKRRTIVIEEYHYIVYKDRRKLHVVFHEWNQSKYTNRSEQYVGPAFKNLKLKTKAQTYDRELLTTDKWYEHYKANEDRIIFKDGLLLQ